MKKLLAYLWLPLVSSLAGAALTPTKTFNFGKGVNYNTIATDLEDNESPDCCNMISDVYGAATKRRGSRRINDQAFSTNPINTIARVYASSGTNTQKATILATWDRILYSTSDLNQVWIKAATGLAHNQYFSVTRMGNKVLMTGSALTDNIKQIDIVSNSTATDLFTTDPSSDAVKIRGKYSLNSKNYYLLGNVADVTLTGSTTYYRSRMYYSIVLKPSSMTASRYIDFNADDGDEIMGMGNLFDATQIFKQNSIFELTFTNLDLPSLNGDWIKKQVVADFGLISPRTLVNTGDYYVFWSKDGIRIWDGGRRNRLTQSEESRVISFKIQPRLDAAVRAGTFRNATAVYYSRRRWYLLAFEDPDLFPRGRNNTMIAYDFNTQEWFPICGWQAASLETQDKALDLGELLYGDANDGFFYMADQDTRGDDAKKNLALNNMDSGPQWSVATDTTNFIEGASSIRISAPGIGGSTSTTLNAIFPLGEWYDKTRANKDDYISFKIRPSTLSKITSLRIDLEVDDVKNFDTSFTSVTISSSALTSGEGNWTEVKIALSSFPIRPDWTDLSIESVPFANTLTYYGIRFTATGTASFSLNIDDLRFVQKIENPISAYRYTKLFDMGSPSSKDFVQLFLTREKPADVTFSIDVYNDFGSLSQTKVIPAEVSKKIYVCGISSGFNVVEFNSVDFEQGNSTAGMQTDFDFMNGAADYDYLYMGDRTNDKLIKIKKTDLTTFISTYGSLGNGATNFALIHQITIDDDKIYIIDQDNQRLKSHDKSTLDFYRTIGSLGTGTTNFHQPTGVAVDETSIYVADEGNYRIMKFTKASTYSFTITASIDYNTIGETSLAVDERYLYLAYDKVTDTDVEHTDIILEKRDKNTFQLITKLKLYPENSVDISSYGVLGDIALLGDYIYIPFTNDSGLQTGKYYIQKLLKKDFSLVRQYTSSSEFFSVIGDGLAYKPSTKIQTIDSLGTGRYLQLKYYDNERDNRYKLYNQLFLLRDYGIKQEEGN